MDLLPIFDILLNRYGPRYWWPAKTPYEMMVGAILTQNTAWSNVEKAIAGFGDRLYPEYVAGADHDDIAEIIRPTGYYNQKVLKLKALTAWYEKHAYDMEEIKRIDGEVLRSELLGVRGVGPETADSILLYAADKPFFVVDAYTRRILYRLGYEIPAQYDDLRRDIEAYIPVDIYLYQEFHALIVEHAKVYCKKKPTCPGCPLEDLCQQRIQD